MFETERDTYLKRHGFEAASLKAVLFDMDGVLFDSMPNHASSWTRAMAQFGLHITPEEAYENEGRTGHGTINILTRRQWGRDATEEEWKKMTPSPNCSSNAPKPRKCREPADCCKR